MWYLTDTTAYKSIYRPSLWSFGAYLGYWQLQNFNSRLLAHFCISLAHYCTSLFHSCILFFWFPSPQIATASDASVLIFLLMSTRQQQHVWISFLLNGYFNVYFWKELSDVNSSGRSHQAHLTSLSDRVTGLADWGDATDAMDFDFETSDIKEGINFINKLGKELYLELLKSEWNCQKVFTAGSRTLCHWSEKPFLVGPLKSADSFSLVKTWSAWLEKLFNSRAVKFWTRLAKGVLSLEAVENRFNKYLSGMSCAYLILSLGQDDELDHCLRSHSSFISFN